MLAEWTRGRRAVLADSCTWVKMADVDAAVIMKSCLVSLSMHDCYTPPPPSPHAHDPHAVMFGWSFGSSLFVLPFLILCHHVLQTVSHGRKRKVD